MSAKTTTPDLENLLEGIRNKVRKVQFDESMSFTKRAQAYDALYREEAAAYKVLGFDALEPMTERNGERPASMVYPNMEVDRGVLVDMLKELHEEKITPEKESFYADLPEMDGYTATIGTVLAEKGVSFGSARALHESYAWGDTRGNSDYEATHHFRECGVVAVTNVDEYASWSQYDTFSDIDYAGVKAELSCVCGQNYRHNVYYEDTLGDIMKQLFSSR